MEFPKPLQSHTQQTSLASSGLSSGKKYYHALTSASSLEFGVGAEELYDDDVLSVSSGEAVTYLIAR